ncbi:helix-turn-helix domain-containing protein [Paenibacillus sp. HN-1]|uniref:helix-turn-helix domain-containing protein n=1 Tax=Paenibacillus TaxID=44249 RepID=UPI001CA8B2E6|nr:MULTISPECIES: helix-turn-helix domain-containing protein [Paenibacillus]MBY9079199.1 helix-turn-helix domain-containing protein [Paenibacillus sp. CGMCC 1.18879]MBY9087362.1 helix-turn-helix domain-containing protein [Paenibacillus sinensis]
MKHLITKQLFQSRETIARRVFRCFLAVAALFSFFYLTLMSLYHSSMVKQADRSNRIALQHTADRFADRLARVRTLLTELSQDADLIASGGKAASGTDLAPDSPAAVDAVDRIESDMRLAQADLDNIWVLFPDTSLAMTSQGIFDARDLSDQVYANETYTYNYWKGLMADSAEWSILPAAVFRVAEQKRMLLPIVYGKPDSSGLIVALLDMDRSGEIIGDNGIMESLSIWDGEGKLLYKAVEDADEIVPAAIPSNGHRKIDGRMVYSHTDLLGNTYLSMLSGNELVQDAYCAHRTAIALLAAALVTVLAAAVLFSLRIQAPARALLASMHRMLPAPAKGRFTEYRLIQDKLNTWYGMREHAENRLRLQQSALLDYRYMDLLRGTDNDEIGQLAFSPVEDRPFMLVLYSLRPWQSSQVNHAEDNSLSIKRILGIIQPYLSQRYPDSRTFQMEHDQIISVIPGEERGGVVAMLQDELLDALQPERCGCVATVSVSYRYTEADKYNEAYLEVLEINRSAPLSDESILISERYAPPPLRLTPRKEQELNAALKSGNADNALRIADHALAQLASTQAGIAHYSELALQLLERFRTAFASMSHDDNEAGMFARLETKLNQCREPAAYQEAIAELIRFICDLRPQETVKQDPVAALVLDILNTRYDQDLSLSKIADKLNMSSAYLSVYIKEKTGTNFSDHLNDIRLRKAMDLLVCTDQSVTAVSKQVGYANFTSFNRMFKRQTGMSPGEYRKSQITKIHKAR